MMLETQEEKLQQHRVDWHYDAECAKLGINPEWYFDERNTLGMRAVRSVCASCPVIVECIKDAYRHSDCGLWGGLTEAERHKYLPYLLDTSFSREALVKLVRQKQRKQ